MRSLLYLLSSNLVTRLRRAGAGISDPLTPPSSPPRPALAAQPSESEVFWKERLETVIQEKLARWLYYLYL